MSAELWTRPIESLAPDLRAGRVSPVELAESALDRIRRHDDRLHSYVHVSDTALEHARQAEREISDGQWRGPLHGIPIGVKDNYLTRDMPTRNGTAAPGISFPSEDSSAVARLRAAGAVLTGKTRLHEFAWGTVTPPARNPWDLDRVVGGSSGGSGVAVVAGLCAAALGSDTGGSIRIPSSICGTVGLKATYGRVSRAGLLPHTWSLDVAGPLTRTVADAAIMLGVLAGFDPADPGCQDRPVPDYAAALGQPVRGLRIGVCRNHFFGRNQTDVESAVEQAIRDLAGEGMTVREFQIPNLEYGLGAIFAVELPSSTAYHDVWLRAGKTPHYEPDVRSLVEIGRFVTGADYLKGEQFRRVLMEDFRRAFEEVDVILAPTTALTAWRHDATTVEIAGEQESVLAAGWRLTYPFNLTGVPVVSVPCGFDRDGLPIGLQIAAKPFDETMVLRVAHAYEQSHDWWTRTPEL
jgi:aspartyl-tRNA(Asn)/glutamyl-tRNA(Gln) amidotransferase subunit A